MFLWKSNLSQLTIFDNTSICVEESNHLKDHMPVRNEASSFRIKCPQGWNVF